MTTKEDAIKKIKELTNAFDSVRECEKGYVFYHSGEYRCDGGGAAPKVVMKATGQILSMPQAVIAGLGEDISEERL